MNIGSEAATTASQTGTRRRLRGAAGVTAGSGASARTSRVVDILGAPIEKKALNDYFKLDVSNQLITCQA
jgi:hypothetical protein